jgi:hypothetical protein
MRSSQFLLFSLALVCICVTFACAADVDFSAGSHATGFGGGGSGGGGRPPNQPPSNSSHGADKVRSCFIAELGC